MASMAPTRFGEMLRSARQAAGLTQAELAERAGLSLRGVNDLERGARQTPRKDTVALLAAALGLTGEDLAAFAAAARRTLLRSPPPAPAGDLPSAVTAMAERPAETVTIPQQPGAAEMPSPSAPPLPMGTVTFLFTDLEGSTLLLQQLGAQRYARERTEYERLLRGAVAAHAGREVDSQGDGFFVAFPTAHDALAAAAEAQRAFDAHPWPEGAAVRVRMGLHTGTAQVVGERYVGLDVHRAARIGACGHGGQVLLSAATRELVEDALPEGALLRDLGAHRLKDLQRPEHLWQLVLPNLLSLPAEFPSLATLEAHPHNLPIQPTPLVGRKREVAALAGLLHREEVRLVTLTGPGGTGKTRLGLQVAAELAEAFADGVWFVRLSRLADPELVLPTIAQTLGVREVGEQPIATRLADSLHNKQVLLVLDNFEQVVVAATAVARLLETCAGLKVLVTSRLALHVQGEKQYQVRPLPLPDPAHLSPTQDLVQNPAVALFVQHAQDADATFALSNATALAIAAICTRLDGLPLAIELAAAKVRVLPPPALLARLEHQLPLLVGGARDMDTRQQTMRATLAWSEDLLSPKQQRLFRRLAVFVGGFTLEAAEAVCAAPDGAEPLGRDVLEGLEALMDQSLIQQWTMGNVAGSGEGDGDVRFRMMHVIREYALEQLEAHGEAEALRHAHAACYLGLAEQAEPELEGAGQVEGARRVERDYDNLRAALGWLRDRGDVARGLRLAVAIGDFWITRGLVSEGRTWLEGLLAVVPLMKEPEGAPGGSGRMGDTGTATRVPARIQARARCYVGDLALCQSDWSTAAVQLKEGLALSRAAGDGWTVCYALHGLSDLARAQGESEQASAYSEESLAVARDLGEPRAISEALWEVGAVAYDRGDLDRAAAYFEEGLAKFPSQIHPRFLASTLWFLSTIALRRGNPTRAIALLREKLLVDQELGRQVGIGHVLENLAWAAAQMSQSRRAARLLGAAAVLLEGVEDTVRAPRELEEVEAGVAPAREELGEAGWVAGLAEGRALSLEEAIAEALGEPR